MGNFSKDIEDKKERRNKENTRNEKLAAYFYDLSKLTFAGLVIGGVSPIFTGTVDRTLTVWLTSLGFAFATILAVTANKILKR